MSKLVELMEQLNIEPTSTKILLFKQWAKLCLDKTEKQLIGPAHTWRFNDGIREAIREAKKNIEEG